MAAADDDNLGSSPDDTSVIAYAHHSRFHGRDGDAGDADDFTATSSIGRTWRQELPRWLASLNPGRTGREYEKAVCYFFDTPGVPDELPALTFDLLLAYRGALALRAAPRGRGAAYAPRTPRRTERADAIDHPRPTLALSTGDRGAEPGASAAADTADSAGTVETRPLAPATVNIRLTALRQFLVHCAMLGLLPELAPDRIRAALRRLPIEHRRPYQILDEAEWEGFLRAALLPASPAAPTVPANTTHSVEERTRGPWGIPRAVQQERAQTQADGTAGGSHAGADAGADAGAEPTESSRSGCVVKSRFGLTGARTAQRDHALVALALATGLRAIELSQLDVCDLQREWHDGHEEWWLVLPDAKTKGQKGGRTLPLAPSLVETLMAYIRASGRRWEYADDRLSPLFLSRQSGRRAGGALNTQAREARPSGRRGGRLSTVQIRHIVNQIEQRWIAMRSGTGAGTGPLSSLAAETRAISPHALRHSTAIALLQGNVGSNRPPATVEHVRGWLGHFDIRTTQGYLAHLESREHRRPLALTLGEPSSSMQSDKPQVSQRGKASESEQSG